MDGESFLGTIINHQEDQISLSIDISVKSRCRCVRKAKRQKGPVTVTVLHVDILNQILLFSNKKYCKRAVRLR